MKKFWNLGSKLFGLLILICLPLPGLIYNNPISGTYKAFSMFRMIFGYKDYNVKFNIIILLVFIIIILTGFIDVILKDKIKANLIKMFVYVFDIIIFIFCKGYFMLINKDYLYKGIEDANKSGYALLIGAVILLASAYFSYMNFIYEYEDSKNNKKN